MEHPPIQVPDTGYLSLIDDPLRADMVAAELSVVVALIAHNFYATPLTPELPPMIDGGAARALPAEPSPLAGRLALRTLALRHREAFHLPRLEEPAASAVDEAVAESTVTPAASNEAEDVDFFGVPLLEATVEAEQLAVEPEPPRWSDNVIAFPRPALRRP